MDKKLARFIEIINEAQDELDGKEDV